MSLCVDPLLILSRLSSSRALPRRPAPWLAALALSCALTTGCSGSKASPEGEVTSSSAGGKINSEEIDDDRGAGGAADGLEPGGSGGKIDDLPAGPRGTQADPGTEGDGTHAHPGPYSAPPEAEGEPRGELIGGAGGLLYTSEIYGGWEFPYWIYVPEEYVPGSPAALMVFQDGICYINCDVGFHHVPQVFDHLIAEGSMPVTLGLFLNPPRKLGAESHTDDDRAVAYDSLSDRYARFLTEEIIPDVLLSTYDLVDDGDGWAIGGHSSGGICAFTVGWHRPDKFRKILTHNGSFVDIAVKRNFEQVSGLAYPELILAENPNKPLRVYLLSGPGDIQNEYGDWFAQNDAVAAALAEKGYHYRYLRGTSEEGTGHFPPLQASSDLAEALRWLFRGYTIP